MSNQGKQDELAAKGWGYGKRLADQDIGILNVSQIAEFLNGADGSYHKNPLMYCHGGGYSVVTPGSVSERIRPLVQDFEPWEFDKAMECLRGRLERLGYFPGVNIGASAKDEMGEVSGTLIANSEATAYIQGNARTQVALIDAAAALVIGGCYDGDLTSKANKYLTSKFADYMPEEPCERTKSAS